MNFRDTAEAMRRSLHLLNDRFDEDSSQFILSQCEEEYEDEERESTQRNQEGTQQTNTDVGMLQEIRTDLVNLKKEFGQFKRKVEDNQSEMLGILKKIKCVQEAEGFDIGNCPHTDAINKILSRYYIQVGRFVKDNAVKKQHLERLFQSSVTGLSKEELMERVGSYEKKRFSYWRTEERRRVLAMSGWEALQAATTQQLTKKIIHLVGQKGNSTCEEFLFRDLVLLRQYVREVGLPEARKDQNFWLSYGRWRINNYASPTEADWRTLVENDNRIYQ